MRNSDSKLSVQSHEGSVLGNRMISVREYAVFSPKAPHLFEERMMIYFLNFASELSLAILISEHSIPRVFQDRFSRASNADGIVISDLFCGRQWQSSALFLLHFPKKVSWVSWKHHFAFVLISGSQWL